MEGERYQLFPLSYFFLYSLVVSIAIDGLRSDLLDAIEAHQLNPRERQWLTSVRNAFCHNSYYKIDMQQIEKKLPTIIQQIVEIVQRITDKASHPSNR